MQTIRNYYFVHYEKPEIEGNSDVKNLVLLSDFPDYFIIIICS